MLVNTFTGIKVCVCVGGGGGGGAVAPTVPPFSYATGGVLNIPEHLGALKAIIMKFIENAIHFIGLAW